MPHTAHQNSNIHITKAVRLFSLYGVIFLFYYLGDAIMSYFSPIFIERHLKDPLLLGLVISSSSCVGYIVDILLSNKFPRKDYYFFMLTGTLLALGFPLSFLLPTHVVVMFMAMAIWGIYFEFFSFSNFRAIHDILPKEKRDFAWGMTSSLSSLAVLVGPLIASALFAVHFRAPLGGALIMYAIALSGAIFFYPFHRDRQSFTLETNISLWKEIKIWNILNQKLWPYLLYTFLSVMVSAVFWTIGPVLAERLSHSHYLGGMLLTAYLLPFLIFSIFTDKIAAKFGTDKSVFVSGMLAGITLIIVGTINGIIPLIIFVFLAGTFLAIGTPIVSGVIERYMSRLGNSANSLIGLRNSFSSLAYIIGPLCSGIAAKYIGYQLTFSLFGVGITMYCAITLIIMPKHIFLPQREIKAIETEE